MTADLDHLFNQRTLANGSITPPESTHHPLRVLLASSSSGSRGGGELYLCGLAQGLAQLGHEVHAVVSQHSRMDELAAQLSAYGPVHRVRYQNTYDRRLRGWGAALARGEIHRLRDELSAINPDIIHLNKQNLEDGLDLLAAAEATRLPTAATIHVTRSMHSLRALAGGLRDWLARRILQNTTCPLIAISESGVTDLVHYGIHPARVHLVFNGVAAAPSSDREAVRRSWNCQPDEIVLGCVARIEPQKNPLFMPSLLAALPRHVRLVWIGDGSLKHSLQQLAADQGVADRVLLPGWQHNARSFLPGFDVFVLPSLYEGFPFAILEAMAAGLPCVVSDVDGVAEAVTDGETGFVCPPDDQDIWLDRINRYVANLAARQQAGARAQARYQENFSLEVMARKTEAIYYEEIGSPARSASCSRRGTP